MDLDSPFRQRILDIMPSNIIYLENSSVNLMGLNIYGSPYTPTFYKWAFMRDRGEPIRAIWNKIPENLDILITHGPPYGILDRNRDGVICGCEELLKAVKLKKPRYHVFGHIHNWGQEPLNIGPTTFINASVCNEDYAPLNKIHYADIEPLGV
jgi:Icc-related predicted phosphoesterase